MVKYIVELKIFEIQRQQGATYFMDRPKFEEIKSYNEFASWYWYLAELKAICRGLGVEYIGGKIELNKIIKSYFDGVKILHAPKKSSKQTAQELKMETKIIDCNFVFNQKFRDFFIAQTLEPNFKFTADMVATVKAVKANKDDSITLGDLLEIKRGNKEYVKYDNSSCQWNKYLKAFCADPQNDIYENKLNTAIQFWQILRKTNLPKTYSREFNDSNRNLIK